MTTVSYYYYYEGDGSFPYCRVDWQGVGKYGVDLLDNSTVRVFRVDESYSGSTIDSLSPEEAGGWYGNGELIDRVVRTQNYGDDFSQAHIDALVYKTRLWARKTPLREWAVGTDCPHDGPGWKEVAINNNYALEAAVKVHVEFWEEPAQSWTGYRDELMRLSGYTWDDFWELVNRFDYREEIIRD